MTLKRYTWKFTSGKEAFTTGAVYERKECLYCDCARATPFLSPHTYTQNTYNKYKNALMLKLINSSHIGWGTRAFSRCNLHAINSTESPQQRRRQLFRKNGQKTHTYIRKWYCYGYVWICVRENRENLNNLVYASASSLKNALSQHLPRNMRSYYGRDVYILNEIFIFIR